MIGYFPTPYPDEVFYSILARYSDRLPHRRRVSAMRQLFGGLDKNLVDVSLPGKLGTLIENMPPGHRLTVERLVGDYTEVPFYTPFLTAERREAILARARGDTRGGMPLPRLGANSLLRLEWLRFCPLCSEEDVRNPGERYWHRIHQIHGVEVCPTHEVFLEESPVRRRNWGVMNELIAAESAVRVISPRPLDPSDACHAALLNISRDALWLLNRRGLTPRPETVRNKYLRLLYEQGFVNSNGWLRSKEKLRRAFLDHHPPALLGLLNCGFDERYASCWLFRLIEKWAVPKHPIKHLLLMHFLGSTAEEFFCRVEELSSEVLPKTLPPPLSCIRKTPPSGEPYPPEAVASEGASASELSTTPRPEEFFGEGPWPCLNPAAEHHLELKVEECRVYVKKKKRVVGRFFCECGFVYSRRGPDRSPEDRFKRGCVMYYGAAWDEAFKTLWEDGSISLRDVARRLKGDYKTLMRQANRLSLKTPRGGGAAEHLPGDGHEGVREHNRKSLKDAVAASPGADRSLLSERLGAVYEWLLTNDPEWSEAHLPPRWKRSGRPRVRKKGEDPERKAVKTPKAGRGQRAVAKKRRKAKAGKAANKVKWKERDALLEKMVREAAFRLRNSDGRPRRITNTSVASAIASYHAFTKLSKLPRTAEALASVVETREAFAVRRVEWVANYFRRKNLRPVRSKLIRRANVEPLMADPRVRSAVDKAMESFDPFNWESYSHLPY